MIEKLKILGKHEVIERINFLQNEIELLKPLKEEDYNRVMNKFRLEWNYNSNAIEGNRLNFGETIAFLRHGITAKGKPLKDHLDIRGHNEAIDFMLDIVKNKRLFNETDIRSLHEIILVEPYETDAVTPDGQPVKKKITLGKYKTLPNHVKTVTGEMHYYASPEETPAKMGDLMKWYSKADNDNEIHPLVPASVFHHRFVSIHPFDDGNGRLARILMNLILMRKGYPPVVIKMANRETYYGVLAQADAGDDNALIEFMGENLVRSLEIYLKGAKGEDINDADDIDKEIELLKASLDKKDIVTIARTRESVSQIFEKSLSPFYNSLYSKIQKLNDLFVDIQSNFHLKIIESYSVDVSSIDELIKLTGKYPFNTKFNPECILQIRLAGFKKSKTPFNITIGCTLIFNEFNYRVQFPRVIKNNSLDKLYHEYLSNEEIIEAINGIVKSVIQEIETKSKEN